MSTTKLTEIEYYLNNANYYSLSTPPPRSDTYGRDGWFYMNYLNDGSRQQCNFNIYNNLDAIADDVQNSANFLYLNKIQNLYFEITNISTPPSNLSDETMMDYYPYIVIGTKTKNDGNNISNDFRSLIYYKISSTLATATPAQLMYLYRNGRNLTYSRSVPVGKNNIFSNDFKEYFTDRKNTNLDDINTEQIINIWIESKNVATPQSISFIVHEAGISSTNMLFNFNRVIKYKNILTNLTTNKEQLILYNGSLSGLTPFPINTYSYKNCVIYCNVSATTGSTQKNVFLSYSPDSVNYYTDSKNIICQEFGTAGEYTGVVRLQNVGFQFIKIFVDDAHITNVKIAYSLYN